MRRRILVVDDEPGMLRATRRVLEQSYDVACTTSPDEALELFSQFRPDVAIVDIRMPRMDGFELIGRLKALDDDLDVILMTGSVGEGDRKLVRAIREKAFYFIHKPFDREVLLTLIGRCLELRDLAEQNRRHVRRLEGILAEARAFQASLLPPVTESFGDTRLDASYLSCDELCGDFYDFASRRAQNVAFVVADVSGHGAAAAMLTGVVKSSFRSCGPDLYDPLAVVERISAGIRGFRDNRFVTLFCGRLDLECDRLDYVSAGHPHGILWDAGGGEPQLLESTGPIVSPAFADFTWEREARDFPRGSRLLLYTDGVLEAPGPEGEYGLDRLIGVVRRAPGGGRPLLDAITEDVRTSMHGRRPPDDMTLLVVGR